MKLDVSEAIRNPGTEYVFSGEQAIATQEISGDTVSYDVAQLKGTFFATDAGDIAVDGTVSTVAHARCARCLAPAEAEVVGEFHETFLRNGPTDDGEVFSYEGYQVDLERLAAMSVLYETPMRFLCREDCDGYPEGYAEDKDISILSISAEEELPRTQRPFAALQQLLDAQSDSQE